MGWFDTTTYVEELASEIMGSGFGVQGLKFTVCLVLKPKQICNMAARNPVRRRQAASQLAKSETWEVS